MQSHGETMGVHDRESLQGRAITGAEFFNRYPSLHHFLLTQLQAATHQLQQGATVVHPSLTPVLALLSRLRCLSPPGLVRLCSTEVCYSQPFSYHLTLAHDSSNCALCIEGK